MFPCSLLLLGTAPNRALKSVMSCAVSNPAPSSAICSLKKSSGHALQVVRDNLYDAFYKLTDSRSQITSYVFDVVRSTVPKIILDDVFTVRAQSWR